MKAEVLFDEIVIINFIEDLIANIEHNMQFVETSNSYFEQLSVEKFALEELLDEIRGYRGTDAVVIIEQFVRNMNAGALESEGPNDDFVFSIARDAAKSILDGLFYETLYGDD